MARQETTRQPSAGRLALAWGYVILALGAPLMVLLNPGQPPLSLNPSLLALSDGQFADHRAALGEGADKYSLGVVDDLAGVLASAAADYPDGSNALIALFDAPESAAGALHTLKQMIPHEQEEHDLWAEHFTSDSGEYVLLAQVERLLVMIITEREAMARRRLAALPALHYNPSPGLGAVLRQQPGWVTLLALAFYSAVQWLLIRLLFAWARPRPTEAPKHHDQTDG